MTAIGARASRADRRIASAQTDRELAELRADAMTTVRATLRTITAARIRARAAVAREAIAEQAEVSAKARAARRAEAVFRREDQRRTRVAAGTDRATIRALRTA